MKIKLYFFLAILCNVNGNVDTTTTHIHTEERLLTEERVLEVYKELPVFAVRPCPIKNHMRLYKCLFIENKMRSVCKKLFELQERKKEEREVKIVEGQEQQEEKNDHYMYSRLMYKILMRSFYCNLHLQRFIGFAVLLINVIAAIVNAILGVGELEGGENQMGTVALPVTDLAVKYILALIFFRMSFYITKNRLIAFIVSFAIFDIAFGIFSGVVASRNNTIIAILSPIICIIASIGYVLIWRLYYFPKHKARYLYALQYLMDKVKVKTENEHYSLTVKKNIPEVEKKILTAYTMKYFV